MSNAVPPIQALAQTSPSLNGTSKPAQPGFVESLNHALEQVSAAQHTSDVQNRAVVTGAPGASLEKALQASAHARIGWNATVAVRNHIVNAYSTIMNMPV